jgi:hypothetical protein
MAPGLHRLDFSRLPVSLTADSVRAAGKGTAANKVLVWWRRGRVVRTIGRGRMGDGADRRRESP